MVKPPGNGNGQATFRPSHLNINKTFYGKWKAPIAAVASPASQRPFEEIELGTQGTPQTTRHGHANPTFFDMSSGPKRKNNYNDASVSKKQAVSGNDTPVRRHLLQRCYASVATLREHVLSRLPRSSRLRRRKIASIGAGEDVGETEAALARLLDASLVCGSEYEGETRETRWQQWLSFSQKGDESNVTISGGVAGSIFCQSEVCFPSSPWH